MELEKDILDFRDELLKYRESRSEDILDSIIIKLEVIETKNRDLGEFFSQSLKECIELLRKKNITKEEVRDMKYFACAWGRGQQYISFCKDDFKI
ncbi:hypothetical protein [Helicobacter ibis]|uniref:Uncharacterized protein n=2 Tax=Helicobacter TaxID=209 RepID=A0ABT4VEJ2_9HELI|nr:hypothetical protein [Helicobacter ibis]MDA3969127.1 hypothetical protein [Helicobacter ibis]